MAIVKEQEFTEAIETIRTPTSSCRYPNELPVLAAPRHRYLPVYDRAACLCRVKNRSARSMKHLVRTG